MPTIAVAYPALFNTSATVVSPAFSPPVEYGNSTFEIPHRTGYRPVINAARLGEHSGDVE
ncbi:MAG: hypothetical protein IPJ98_23770 [Bryobacterales bacterium]|nr:hypothetical protein [Bryobacterales bacterium]